MIDSLYDVAIIGGGPAGLSIGAELSRMGHKVLVIEKGNIGLELAGKGKTDFGI